MVKDVQKNLLKRERPKKIVSKRRKALTAFHETGPWVCPMLDLLQLANFLKEATLINHKEWFKKNMKKIILLDQQYPHRKGILQLISEFTKQTDHPTLYDYAKFISYSEYVKFDMIFFKKFKVDPDEYYLEVIQSDFEYYFEKYRTLPTRLPIQIKTRVLHDLAFRLSVRERGLAKSNWTPKDKVDVLIKEIERFGPMGVLCNMGLRFYEDAPQVMKDPIGGRKILYWPKGSARAPLTVCHSLIINGAMKPSDPKKEGNVIFSEIEDSDPTKPENLKLIMISYETFKKCVHDLSGEERDNASSDIGYLVYRP